MKRRCLYRLASGLAVVFMLVGCQNQGQSGSAISGDVPELENPVGIEVDMVKVMRRDVCDEVVHVGEVIPKIIEMSFGSEGQIGKMNVSIGDKVKKGEVLATLLNMSNADGIKAKKAEISEWRKNSKSVNKISETEISALEDERKEIDKSYRQEKNKKDKKKLQNQLLTKQYDIKIAKKKREQEKELQSFELSKLEKELKEMEKGVSSTRLIAPVDSDVISINKEADSFVQAGQTVIRLGRMSSPRIRTSFILPKDLKKSSGYIAAVEGKEYEVETEEVRVEDWQIDYDETPSHTYFDFLQKNVKCKIGNFAIIHLKKSESKNTLSVPINAIWDGEGVTYVYVDENGTKVRRTVTVGVKSAAYAEILTGVKEGEFVYVEH